MAPRFESCHVFPRSGHTQLVRRFVRIATVTLIVISSAAMAIRAEAPSASLPSLFERTVRQSDIRLKESFFKHHPATLNEFAAVVSNARNATVRVLQEEKQVALGTVLKASGYLVTKFSELNEEKPIQIQTADGTVHSGKLTDVSKDWDLALIRVSAELVPLEISDTSVPGLGSFLAAVDVRDRPFSIGAVSVLPRALRRGFLGISMAKRAGEPGVVIQHVTNNSAASEAGLKAGDVVLSVDGSEVNELVELSALIGNHRPGDEITIQLKRDDESLEVKAVLGERQRDLRNSRNANRAPGLPVSKKKTGFPNVLQHDLFIRPHQCGGPIVDLDGRPVGINIARNDRVTSYAIPIADVAGLLDEDETGYVRFARSLRQIESDLSAAESALQKSLRELEENRKRFEELQKEAERARARTR